jgi:hypothetical protein
MLQSLTFMPPERVSLVTFGAPRIGNPVFADLIKSQNLKFVARIVHYNDVVPHLVSLVRSLSIIRCLVACFLLIV